MNYSVLIKIYKRKSDPTNFYNILNAEKFLTDTWVKLVVWRMVAKMGEDLPLNSFN